MDWSQQTIAKGRMEVIYYTCAKDIETPTTLGQCYLGQISLTIVAIQDGHIDRIRHNAKYFWCLDDHFLINEIENMGHLLSSHHSAALVIDILHNHWPIKREEIL